MAIYTPSESDELKNLLKNRNVFLGDIDTSKITNMAWIFKDVERHTLRGIENWNVSNVTNMDFMFIGRTDFDEDITNWDVSNVRSMVSMFGDAESITSTDFSKWNLHHEVDMSQMFYSCKHLEEARLPRVPASAITLLIFHADPENSRFIERTQRANICNKEIFSITNCDVLKSKIDTKGFFGNSIPELKKKILSNQKELLVSINPSKLACFVTQERRGNIVIREDALCLAYFEKEKAPWDR